MPNTKSMRKEAFEINLIEYFRKQGEKNVSPRVFLLSNYISKLDKSKRPYFFREFFQAITTSNMSLSEFVDSTTVNIKKITELSNVIEKKLELDFQDTASTKRDIATQYNGLNEEQNNEFILKLFQMDFLNLSTNDAVEIGRHFNLFLKEGTHEQFEGYSKKVADIIGQKNIASYFSKMLDILQKYKSGEELTEEDKSFINEFGKNSKLLDKKNNMLDSKEQNPQETLNSFEIFMAKIPDLVLQIHTYMNETINETGKFTKENADFLLNQFLSIQEYRETINYFNDSKELFNNLVRYVQNEIEKENGPINSYLNNTSDEHEMLNTYDELVRKGTRATEITPEQIEAFFNSMADEYYDQGHQLPYDLGDQDFLEKESFVSKDPRDDSLHDYEFPNNITDEELQSFFAFMGYSEIEQGIGNEDKTQSVFQEQPKNEYETALIRKSKTILDKMEETGNPVLVAIANNRLVKGISNRFSAFRNRAQKTNENLGKIEGNSKSKTFDDEDKPSFGLGDPGVPATAVTRNSLARAGESVMAVFKGVASLFSGNKENVVDNKPNELLNPSKAETNKQGNSLNEGQIVDVFAVDQATIARTIKAGRAAAQNAKNTNRIIPQSVGAKRTGNTVLSDHDDGPSL